MDELRGLSDRQRRPDERPGGGTGDRRTPSGQSARRDGAIDDRLRGAEPAVHRPEVPAALDGRRARFRGRTAIAAVVVAGLVGGVTGTVIASDVTGSSTGVLATSDSAGAVSTRDASTGTVDVSAVVKKVLPSVVQIDVRTDSSRGIGSGIILNSSGLILTNNHVVSGASSGSAVTVTFNDGRQASARVVRTDRSKDLAVVQASRVSGRTPVSVGDSDSVRIGDQVVAVGSPGGLQGTVTSGIVSALDRKVTAQGHGQSDPRELFPFTSNHGSGSGEVSYRAIQTDAALNEGNSGGPLFNARGQLIGINSAMYSPSDGASSSSGSVGVGFSIPINQAKTIIEQSSRMTAEG
ncbi:MAG: S1C family serine protease [Sciscionella sp.]